MTELSIDYRYTLANGRQHLFSFVLDPQTLEAHVPAPADPPPWTALGFQQCPNCPLRADAVVACPAALNLAHVVPRFEPLLSYDRVRLEVTTEERTIAGETTVQQALSSMLGLVMATSGCPHTRFLKAMARFHLPLATEEETLFRSVATYLLARHLRAPGGVGGPSELNGLHALYAELRVVNSAFTKRLRAAGRTDATLNALVLLDVFAILVPTALEDSLSGLREMLQPVFAHLEALERQ
jgi:hypothetical protein